MIDLSRICEDRPQSALKTDWGPKFKELKNYWNGESWYLVKQVSTAETRWINKNDLETKTIEEAFYDADPVFTPIDNDDI